VPRKTFVAGEILTALDVNTNLMDQAVMTFADAAERTAELPSPLHGMVTYLKDTDSLEVFDDSAFVPVGVEPAPPAILQVVSIPKTDANFSTGSSSFTDVSDLTASITPSSASNKVLVTVSVGVGVSGTSIQYGLTITDGSNNNLIAADSPGSRLPAIFHANNNSTQITMVSYTFLHSPATTSAFTYKVRAQTQSGTMFVNRNGSDTNAATNGRTVSTITLMEVAG
jgi:hypothetical protein